MSDCLKVDVFKTDCRSDDNNIWTSDVFYDGSNISTPFIATYETPLNTIIQRIADSIVAVDLSSLDSRLDDLEDWRADIEDFIENDLSDLTVKYVGTNPVNYTLPGNPHVQDVLYAIDDEFTDVYAAISAISTGVNEEYVADQLSPVVTNYIDTGVSITSLGYPSTTFSTGIVYIDGLRVDVSQTIVTLTNSKDNWVYVRNDGTFNVKLTNISGVDPGTDAGQIIVGKITVSAGVPTNNTGTLRNLYPFDGGSLANNSVITRHITDANVTLAKLATAVSNRLLPLSPSTGDFAYYNGSAWALTSLSIPTELDDLTDVIISSPSANDVLYYNGTHWVNDTFGKLPLAVTTTSDATYTVTDNDNIIAAQNVAGSVEIVLPEVATNTGKTFTIITLSDSVAHNVVISVAGAGKLSDVGSGTGTLQNDTTIADTEPQLFTFYCDGNNYYGK